MNILIGHIRFDESLAAQHVNRSVLAFEVIYKNKGAESDVNHFKIFVFNLTAKMKLGLKRHLLKGTTIFREMKVSRLSIFQDFRKQVFQPNYHGLSLAD